MTAALTSIYAYHGVQAHGTETRQKEQIVACVKRAVAAGGTGLTRREISQATGIEPGAVGGRCNALVRDEKLKDGHKRPCTVTGKLAKEVQLP